MSLSHSKRFGFYISAEADMSHFYLFELEAGARASILVITLEQKTPYNSFLELGNQNKPSSRIQPKSKLYKRKVNAMRNEIYNSLHKLAICRYLGSQGVA